MGNEDKISKKQLPAVKSHFLPEEFSDVESKTGYSLEREFGKTSKNRNYRLYLLVCGFLIILSGVTLLVTRHVEKGYQANDLEFASITDLNLQELLSKAKQNEKKLARAREELKELNTAMERALASAGNASKKQAVMNKYNPLISAKKAEVSKYQSDVDSYDLRLRENIRKAEAIVNNYKKLHELQMSSQKKYYEQRISETILKYNPWFSNPALTSILRERFSSDTKFSGQPETFDRAMLTEGLISQREYQELKRLTENRARLASRIKEIPYINSAGAGIKKLDEIDSIILNRYETLRQKMLNAIKNKSAWLNSYNYALDSFTRIKPENGYIIDARNTSSISLFVNPIYRAASGDTASVFRNDDEIIATIKLFNDGKSLKAKTVNINPGKSIQPMDKILLHKMKSRNQTGE